MQECETYLQLTDKIVDIIKWEPNQNCDPDIAKAK